MQFRVSFSTTEATQSIPRQRTGKFAKSISVLSCKTQIVQIVLQNLNQNQRAKEVEFYIFTKENVETYLHKEFVLCGRVNLNVFSQWIKFFQFLPIGGDPLFHGVKNFVQRVLLLVQFRNALMSP